MEVGDKIEYNGQRLKYLLSLYKMTEDDLLDKLNEKRRKKIKREDVFSNAIDIRCLKNIDKIFNKGIYFYLDPEDIKISQSASIFFRKEKFGTELNERAIQIVNEFEDKKISLSATAKLAELKIERKLDIYSSNRDNPQDIALEIRKFLFPKFNADVREFLKLLISKFAEYNILVFEFVEAPIRREKANIDGFFLQPNVIVIKRQQKQFRREIFTLAHELGHYLINTEEIEENIVELNCDNNVIERWCNDFAYYFLAGDEDSTIRSLNNTNVNNNYSEEAIHDISKKTHLSKLAIYTRLLLYGKITQCTYNIVKKKNEKKYQERKEESEKQKELDKLSGRQKKGSVPKPIVSPLFTSTIMAAFFSGVMNEYDVCKTLNMKFNSFDKNI